LASAMAPHRKGCRVRVALVNGPTSGHKMRATTPVTAAKGYRDPLLDLGPFYADGI
jgi:hypothetical protein